MVEKKSGAPTVHLSAVKTPPSPALVAPPGNSAVPAQPAEQRVVIVGGGIAGLLAAYELDKRGISTHILEATQMWGGRVATAEYEGGATAEYGLQEMWEGNPLLSVARELQVPLDDHPEQAYSSVIIDGKLFPYVQESRDAYLNTLLTPSEKTRFLDWLEDARKLREVAERDGLKNAAVAGLQPISFAKWVQDADLGRRASELVRLMLECEVASDWNSFSALFGLLEFGEFLGEGKKSNHVRGGNARLIDEIARKLGGEKTLSALVTRIERFQDANGQISARIYYQRNRNVYTLEADRVVLAVPFWRLHQIEMIPPLSPEKWQAINGLSRGQYTVVHLVMHSPKEMRNLWLVDGKNPFSVLTDGPLGVIYGVSNAQAGKTQTEAFSMLIHGQYAAAFHMIPRELRLHEIHEHLETLWPGFTQYLQSSHVYTYHPGAIPVWPPGRSPLDELSQKLRQPELGLYLAGDYLYNAHSDGAARAGMHAAERIAAELHAPDALRRMGPRPRKLDGSGASDQQGAAPARPPQAPRSAPRPKS